MIPETSLLGYLGLLGGGIPIAMSVYGFFALLESLASPAAKAGTTAWLQRIDISKITSHWPNNFARLFDRVFGDKHFTLDCFLRSCVASLCFVVLCLFVMFLSGNYLPWEDTLFKAEVRSGRAVDAEVSGYVIFWFVLMFSLLPDYVCLLKTRYAIKLMQRSRGFFIHLPIFIIDIALVPVVWWTVSFIAWALFGYWFGYIIWKVTGEDFFAQVGFTAIEFGYGYATLQQIVVSSGWKSSQAAFFYAEFFTTIWAVLYFLAGSVSRLMLGSQFVVTRLVRFFDVQKKPIQSIGFVAACLSALLWWTITLLPIQDIPLVETVWNLYASILQALMDHAFSGWEGPS